MTGITGNRVFVDKPDYSSVADKKEKKTDNEQVKDKNIQSIKDEPSIPRSKDAYKQNNQLTGKNSDFAPKNLSFPDTKAYTTMGTRYENLTKQHGVHKQIVFDSQKALSLAKHAGFNSIADLQRALGQKPDGVFSEATYMKLKEKVKSGEIKVAKTVTTEQTLADTQLDVKKLNTMKLPEREPDPKVKCNAFAGMKTPDAVDGPGQYLLPKKNQSSLEVGKDVLGTSYLKLKDADRGGKMVKALVDKETKELGFIDRALVDKMGISPFSNLGKLMKASENALVELHKVEKEVQELQTKTNLSANKFGAWEFVEGRIDKLKDAVRKSDDYSKQLQSEISILKEIAAPRSEIIVLEKKLEEMNRAVNKANEAVKDVSNTTSKLKYIGKAGAIGGFTSQTVSTIQAIKKFREGTGSVSDVGMSIVKNTGQIASVIDKFKSSVLAKKLGNSIAAVGSTYDAVKSLRDKKEPIAKKLDKCIMAGLDISSAVSSFATTSANIAFNKVGPVARFATKFAPLEAAVASRLGYGLFAVVSLKKAYDAYKDPNVPQSVKRAAYINAAFDVGTGVAIAVGATTVGHVLLAGKIGYELYKMADEKWQVSDKIADKAQKAATSLSNSAANARSWVGSFFNKPKLQPA